MSSKQSKPLSSKSCSAHAQRNPKNSKLKKRANLAGYEIKLTQSKHSGAWLAELLGEFDFIAMGQGSTIEEAIDDLAVEVFEMEQELGSKKYTGDFRLRMPPEVHRELALEARKKGMSLNKFIVNELQKH